MHSIRSQHHCDGSLRGIPLVLAAALLALPTPTLAQPARAVVVRKTPPEPPPELPDVRLELGFGPATPSCDQDRYPCSALASTGMALRVAAIRPLSDGFSVGGAVTHARFSGSPDTSHFSAITVPFDVHSDLTSVASFRFGLEPGIGSSPGDACARTRGFALGVGVGVRARVRHSFGLALSLSALGVPAFSCSGSARLIVPPPPPARQASIATAHALLSMTYDL